MSPIRYVECETITDKIAASHQLQVEHWEEIARNKHLMVLNPDVEQYARLERAGLLFAVIAYAGDEIIGYSVNILVRNLHYSALLMAQNDLLFVGAAHRGGRAFMRLRDATIAAAARRGARMMLWHAKENTPLAEILPRMGCKVQDIIYSEELPASNFRMVGTFDVGAALAELDASPLWDQFTARQDAPESPHHDTRCIVLRGPDVPEGAVYDRALAHTVIESRDWQANVEALPAARDLCAAASERLRVLELGRVMIVELAPGGHIDQHRDEGAYAEHFKRFHLVLQSDPGNRFVNGDEVLHMRPGELWQFTHQIEHEVFNDSSRPRIHMIIDAITE